MSKTEEIMERFSKEKAAFMQKLKCGERAQFVFEFCLRGVVANVFYEDDDYIQYQIVSVQAKREVYELSERIGEMTAESGDIHELEAFVYAIESGEFDWIKNLYTDLTKILSKYEGDNINRDVLENIVADVFELDI